MGDVLTQSIIHGAMGKGGGRVVLKIAKAVYDRMLHASQEEAPLEACGLIAGTDDHAVRFYAMTNSDASPTHFTMVPEEQFEAVKNMRERGLRLLAIWHSHPATSPRMSDEDLRLAFTPDVAYIIVSGASEAKEPALRGFEVKNGVSKEIEVVIEG